MDNLKNFLSIKVLLSFVLSFSMWIIYWGTDIKINTEGVYYNKIIIYFSIIISLLSSIYFISHLFHSNIVKRLKKFFVVIVSIIGISLLYCNFSQANDFLKQNYSLLVLFSLAQLLILICYGIRESKDTKEELEKSPIGASENGSEEDSLNQTRMSLDLNDENLK